MCTEDENYDLGRPQQATGDFTKAKYDAARSSQASGGLGKSDTKAKAPPRRCNIRSTSNGFIVTGTEQRRGYWALDRTEEFVTTDLIVAACAVTAFMNTGLFPAL